MYPNCPCNQLGNVTPPAESRSMLPWVLGGGVVLFGTWFAVMLVRNGR